MNHFTTGWLLESSFPNAIIHSWADSFYSQIWSWGVDAFHTFRDSFLYYLYDSITFPVAYKFFIFFWIMLAVAFVSSLIFWSWLGNTANVNTKLNQAVKPKTNLFP